MPPEIAEAPETHEAPPGKTSFEAKFMEAVSTDPDKPAPEKKEPAKPTEKPAEKKAEAKESEKNPEAKKPDKPIPDALFKKGEPVEPKTGDKPAEPESELSKIEAPDFKGDTKKQSQWAALHAKAEEFEKRSRELDGKLKAAEETAAKSKAAEARVAELEAERAQHIERISRANAADDPEFIARHVTGRQTKVDALKKMVEDAGGDPKAIETAVNLKGKPKFEATEAAIGELPPFQQGLIARALEEVSQLDSEAEQKLAKPQNYLQERQAQEAEKARQQQQETIKAANEGYANAEKRMAAELEILNHAEGEGFEWWNELGDKIKKESRQFFDTNNDWGNAAEAAIALKALPVYRELFIKERAANAANVKRMTEMEEELKGLYGKSPSLTGGKGGEQTGKKMSFEDRFQHEWKG